MTRPRIEDIRLAITERGFPSVTIWNRVEGRPDRQPPPPTT